MSETLNLKPREGVQVRDPRNAEPLPKEGARVPRNAYWLRRLRDGDVTEVRRAPKSKSNKE